MVMKLPNGDLVVPTGIDVARVSIAALNACSEVADRLQAVGFLKVYTSMRSEACYYALPDHRGVIRVAAHRFGRTEARTVMRPILAKITFGMSQGLVSENEIRQQMLTALGSYFLTRLKDKTNV